MSLNITDHDGINPYEDDNIVPSSSSSLYEYKFEHDETIPQTWHIAFVMFAFFVALISSYSAIRLLDHSVWRADQGKEVFVAETILIQHPDVICAIMLGFGTVWSMHFIGMSAVTLQNIPMCFNWGLTIASLIGAVGLMGWAVSMARQDIFAGSDRVKLLKRLAIDDHHRANKKNNNKTIIGCLWCKTTSAQLAVYQIAFFHKLDKIIMGGAAAASGALLMHYIGMLAVRGPFSRIWRTDYIAGSVILGLVICILGFWIIFRLGWKVDQVWTRPLSATVIAFGVCVLHFFGMLSVTYKYDENSKDVCNHVVASQEATPTGWTEHQMVNLAVGIIVPAMAMLTEILINKEILMAYCKETGVTLDMVLDGARSSKGKTSINSTQRHHHHHPNNNATRVRVSGLTPRKVTTSERRSRASGSKRLPGIQSLTERSEKDILSASDTRHDRPILLSNSNNNSVKRMPGVQSWEEKSATNQLRLTSTSEDIREETKEEEQSTMETTDPSDQFAFSSEQLHVLEEFEKSFGSKDTQEEEESVTNKKKKKKNCNNNNNNKRREQIEELKKHESRFRLMDNDVEANRCQTMIEELEDLEFYAMLNGVRGVDESNNNNDDDRVSACTGPPSMPFRLVSEFQDVSESESQQQHNLVVSTTNYSSPVQQPILPVRCVSEVE